MAIVLTIGGTEIDRAVAKISLIALTPFVKDGVPSFSFARRGIKPPLRIDPYLGKAVTLAIDDVVRFSGDVTGFKHHLDELLGWVAEYQCRGLRHRGDLIPVHDDSTSSDISVFNLRGDDPDFVAARAGRTLGQMIRTVLEGPTNRSALSALGLGAYAGSSLPAATVADLATLDVVPPHRITFQGDRLLDALEANLKQIHPNHCLHVEPDTGTIRFLDLRNFTPLTLTLGTDPVRPPELDYDTSGSFSAVRLRGEGLVEPIELSLLEGSLLEDFAHDGLSNARAKELWRYADFNQPTGPTGGALATCNLTPTTVDSAAVTRGGIGYSTAPTVTVVDAGTEGSGAAFTATVFGGRVTTLTRTAAGSGYVRPPSISFSGGGGSGAAATVTLAGTSVASNIALSSGGSGYISPPAVRFIPANGGPGSGATATTSLTGDAVSAITLTSGGSGYVLPPSVHIGGPVTPTTDYGTCDPAQNTATSVVVTSDDPTRTWAANAWDQDDGSHGVATLYDTVASGVTSYVTRRVVSNTALAAGGTSTLTLDQPLPGTGYDVYSLNGRTAGASIVYRRYKPKDAAIAAAMTADRFAYEFPYQWSEGAAGLTSYPVGTVHFSSGGQPPFTATPIGFDIDSANGVIITHQPVVRSFGTTPNLSSGGPSTDGIPADVRFLVGVYKGVLELRVPESGHEGTSFTSEGIQRVLTVSVSEWRDPTNTANMAQYGQNLLDSVKDTVIEGQVEYLGRYDDGLGFGHTLNLAADGYETGLEAAALPIVSATLNFGATGGPLGYATTLVVSNRRAKHAAGDYLSPTQVGTIWDFGPAETFVGGAPAVFSAGAIPDLREFGPDPRR